MTDINPAWIKFEDTDVTADVFDDVTETLYFSAHDYEFCEGNDPDQKAAHGEALELEAIHLKGDDGWSMTYTAEQCATMLGTKFVVELEAHYTALHNGW